MEIQLRDPSSVTCFIKVPGRYNSAFGFGVSFFLWRWRAVNFRYYGICNIQNWNYSLFSLSYRVFAIIRGIFINRIPYLKLINRNADWSRTITNIDFVLHLGQRRRFRFSWAAVAESWCYRWRYWSRAILTICASAR